MTIGEIDQTVFDCPSCSRPLALGSRRCPGCRTRLVGGVALAKASTFVAVGLTVGLLAGTGGGFLAGLARAAVATDPLVSATASGAPLAGSGAGGGADASSVASDAPATTPSPSPAASTGLTIPPVTRSALIQAVGANDRLAAARSSLKAEMAAATFDASAVAQILRTISADSVFGEQLASRIEMWPGSVAVGKQLATFYDRIHDTAADGLVASVRNGTAYRTAAVAMIKLLDGLPTIDAAVRSAAAAAGVSVPVSAAAP